MISIDREFDGVPRPMTTRSVANALDDEWVVGNQRMMHLNSLDPEINWQDLSEDDIKSSQNYFSFSDDEGWRFYLPAHMMLYLKQFPNCSYDAVYYACTSPSPKFGALSETQLACVKNFVTFIHNEDGGNQSH